MTPVTSLSALCCSSKRLVNTWEIVLCENELEHQSGASALMICAVSLWKSSHACSDGAKDLVRDSTVTNRFNALFPHFAARPALACVFYCFAHCFAMRFRVLRGINRCVAACHIQQKPPVVR